MKTTDFFDELIMKIPALEKEIRIEDTEMIHRRMEIFAQYTIEQIKNEDKPELIKCFYFLENVLDSVSSEIKNALFVSYCETLLLEEASKEISNFVILMGPKLDSLYSEYKKYYNDLVKRANRPAGPPNPAKL